MRVLLLADVNSAHTRRWGEALAAEGIILGIVSLNPTGDDWPDRHGIQAYSAGIAASKGKGSLLVKFDYLFGDRHVREAVADFEPDILHAHYASSYGMLARRSGRPYILSAWGSDVLDFPHRGFLNKRLVVRNLKQASRVLATGTALADAVRKLCGREATVIPFGIDTEQFKPGPSRSGDGPFTFVIVKSLEHLCGVDVAIRALAELKHDARLGIAGLGTEEQALKNLAQSLGVGDRTQFIGWVDNRDVPALLNASDCLLNVSRREGFGVCILEAMACGLPVIASRTPGAAELIDAGRDGLLVAIDDPAETARAMTAIIEDPSLRETLRHNGPAKVRQHYAWSDCVQRMIEVYEQQA